MKYPLTFYTDKYVSEGAAGSTKGPVIFIRPAYRDDKGLYEHELMHVKQWFVVTAACIALLAATQPVLVGLGLAVERLMYTFYPRYRLASEVIAYKEQLRHYADDRTEMFAGFIADNYNLKVTKEEVIEMLRG